MIAGQVREHAGGERDAIDPAQRQRMRRHLHRAGAALSIDHFAQKLLDVGRFGRRTRRFTDLAADAIGDGPEDAAADAGRVEDRRDEIRRRRLAVGAGDADHPHLAAGIAIERRGQHREREPCVRDDRPRNGDAGRRRLLGHDGRRAALDRLPGERRAVGVLPLERDEHLAGRHGARVVRDAGDHAGRSLRAQGVV